MDIASISLGMVQKNVITDVGTAVLSKSLDATETAGAQLIEMIDSAGMERSVTPYIGSNFDASV